MAETWTEDRLAQLRRLWGQGHSGSEIAGILGGVTRNGVIGKANRLRLTRGPQPEAPVVVAAAQASAPTAPAALPPPLGGKRRRRRAVTGMRPMDRSPFPTCQFIAGEPRDRGFCGARTLELRDGRRSSYCPEHHGLCWEDQQPRSKRERAA